MAITADKKDGKLVLGAIDLTRTTDFSEKGLFLNEADLPGRAKTVAAKATDFQSCWAPTSRMWWPYITSVWTRPVLFINR